MQPTPANTKSQGDRALLPDPPGLIHPPGLSAVSDGQNTVDHFHEGVFPLQSDQALAGLVHKRLITFDDPTAFQKPWTLKRVSSLAAKGIDVLEYVCAENNKDVEHLVGK